MVSALIAVQALGVAHMTNSAGVGAPCWNLFDLTLMLEVGVESHNSDAVSAVFCINGLSWNNKRLDGVFFTFQIRDDFVETHRDVTSNIFTKHPNWP